MGNICNAILENTNSQLDLRDKGISKIENDYNNESNSIYKFTTISSTPKNRVKSNLPLMMIDNLNINSENDHIEVINIEENSNDIDNISQIDQEFDYYNHSINVFNFINEIRLNPNPHLDNLEKLINCIEENNRELVVDLNKFFSEYLTTHTPLNLGSDKYKLLNNYSKQNLSKLINKLKKELTNSFNEPLLWSEKVVNVADTQYKKSLSGDCENNRLKVSSNSNVNFEFRGKFDPLITVYLIILEMPLRDTLAILMSDFDCSGILCKTQHENCLNFSIFLIFCKLNL